MRRHRSLAHPAVSQLGQGDVGLSLDPGNQHLATRRQLAAAGLPALPRRRH